MELGRFVLGRRQCSADLIPLSVRIVLPDAGRLQQEPDGRPDHLDGDEHRSDGQLGLGRDETGPPRRPPRALEDPRDAVGLGEQRAVDDGERKAYPEPLHPAHHRGRPGQHHKRHAVAQRDAGEEEVAELPARSLHDGRVVVPEEHHHHPEGEQRPESRDGDRDYGEQRVPLHVLLLQVVAALLVRVGPAAVPAVLARELVHHVLPGVALVADPAADVSRLRDLDLARAARHRADG